MYPFRVKFDPGVFRVLCRTCIPTDDENDAKFDVKPVIKVA